MGYVYGCEEMDVLEEVLTGRIFESDDDIEGKLWQLSFAAVFADTAPVGSSFAWARVEDRMPKILFISSRCSVLEIEESRLPKRMS